MKLPLHDSFIGPELLIKEARQRARRKRLRVGLALVLLVAIAASIWLSTSAGRGSNYRAPKKSNPHAHGATTAATLSSTGAGVPRLPIIQSSPVSSSTVWVITQNQNRPSGGAQAISVSLNGGRTWKNATPAGLGYDGGNRWMSQIDAISSTRAWLQVGGVAATSISTLEATTDGGRHWTVLGPMPLGCQLQFISANDGWCTNYQGALGSMTVSSIRTVDGGRHWSLPVKNDVNNTPPGTLPFGCDKDLKFTSPTVGWALFFCNGGAAPLYVSRNAGRTWHESSLATPPGVFDAGSDFTGTPAVFGRDVVIGFTQYDPTKSFAYVSTNGGRNFRLRALPPTKNGWSFVALSRSHWLILGSHQVQQTTDAGASWKVTASNYPGANYNAVVFASARDGWLFNQQLWRTTDGGHLWHRVVVMS